MIRAAGILFLTKDRSALFLKRGPGGDYPGWWCFPGGKIEDDESALDAAIREAKEETGFDVPADKLVEWTRRIKPRMEPGLAPVDVGPILPGEADAGEDVDFTTFVHEIDNEFVPKRDGEHVGYAWSKIDAPPEPMHPGCRIALQRFGLDELGVARAMANGELTSPQRYRNVWLFDIRITGTGATYRFKHKEYVWRDPSIYLNPDFLARCNGLAVLWRHPKGSMLNGAEYASRAVGAIMLPYIKADEVWGIAKVHDEKVAEYLLKNPMSTSPAVEFDPGVNREFTTEGGKTLLIEGEPSLLDHVALVPNGVWDKLDGPSGVETTGADMAVENSQVRADAEEEAREEKERKDAEEKAEKERKDAEEAKARRDADMGTKLDNMLSKVDEIGKRVDAMDGTRKDAETEAEKKEREDRQDAARRRRDAAHFGRRKDAEDDKAYAARHDAEEGALAKQLEEEGEPKEKAADRSKRARKDAEDMEREDSQRHDDQLVKTLATKVADLETKVPKERPQADTTQLVEAQHRADEAYGAWGERAPAPLVGEEVLEYRRRLLKPMQKHSPDWSKADLARLDAETMPIAETRIYADAQSASNTPGAIPAGTLHARHRTLDGGQRMTEYFGQPSTWMNEIAGPVRHFVTDILEKR